MYVAQYCIKCQQFATADVYFDGNDKLHDIYTSIECILTQSHGHVHVYCQQTTHKMIVSYHSLGIYSCN